MRTFRNPRWLNILILLALALTPLSATAPTQASAPAVILEPEFASDHLLARLAINTMLDESALRQLGVLSARPLFHGQDLSAGLQHILHLDLIPGSDVQAIAESLSGDPRFAWVEPDYLATGSLSSQTSEVWGVATTPNDPLFPDQWGLAKIEAPAAWDVQTGSEMVVVAIVDSGIQRTHPDLQGRLWLNPGEVAGNGLDDDNNGFIDDVHGWDFVSEDNDPADDNGHGTQVAGVVTASTNNNTGIAGTCWNCRLMSVKVMSAGGVANYSDIAQGVLYAAQKGAKVINLSLGGYSFSNALQEAAQSAVNDFGALVVAGAGNDNTSDPFYPAAYDEAIAVAGTDQNDLKASFSDYGAWVDLSAPAVAIQTTFSGGDYGLVDGTSFAAPFVSGVAGLLLSEHSDWSNALARLQMTNTADSIDTLNPDYAGLLGSGRLNAFSALSIAPHPLLEITEKLVNGDPLGRPTPGESSTLEITLANDWLDAQSVQGVLSTADPYVTLTQDTTQFGDLPAGGSGTGSPVFEFDVASGAGYDHPIDFTLELSAYGGYSTALDFTIKTRSAEEQVWGTIGEDTTWTNDKTYIIMGNLGVAPGITLTIEAGTDVKFNGEYSLNVGGQLIADGTEAQPIRFLPNTGSDWGRIYFDDTSIDATADLSGTYQSGTILRWVIVEGASEGIGCNNATPYLSHLTTDGGGMSCTTGSTSLWLLDSRLSGEVMVVEGPDSRGTWAGRTSMPTARIRLGVTSVNNGKIYAIGGYGDGAESNANEEYDPQTDTWTIRANMPTARWGLGVAAANNGKIYAIGGINGSDILNTVEEYDPQTDTWTTKSSMPTARYQLGVAASSNGKLYAIGGVYGENLSTVEEYDPQTDTWTTRASMLSTRINFGVTEAGNGKLYAIGGNDSSYWNTVEEYDPQMDSWTLRANMPTGREQLGVSTTNSGWICAIGGFDGNFNLETVEGYDPHTNTWVTLTNMPTSRIGLGTATANNGKIYAIGGSDGNSVEEFSPPSNLLFFHAFNVRVLNGALSLHANSEVNDSTIDNGITINGAGRIEQVIIIDGGITVGSGQVLSSTLSGGGIGTGDDSVIQGNNIENSPTWGIQTSGAVTIQGNRLVGNAAGIQASGGLVQGNLIADSAGMGLEINGDVSVTDNTFTGNAGNTIVINSGTPTIQGNNLEGNTGAYDIQNLTANDIQAQNNWWGTTQPYPISLRIYDYDDDYNLGEVVYSPVAEGPIQTAPAYVRSVTVDPNPVGIETATFEVEFSRPMDQAVMPDLSFQSVLHNTWSVYNTTNSGLPGNRVVAIASDPDGTLWFGTVDYGVAKFDGSTWTVYNASNSGLPIGWVEDIVRDPDNSHWFATWGGGVAKFDGSIWTVYQNSNSGLPNDWVYAMARHPDGSKWFTADTSGVAKFDDSTWTVYNTSNSGVPGNYVYAIACDPNGTVWIGTADGGAVKFDGSTWTVLNTGDSGLPYGDVRVITIGPDGSIWFGGPDGVAKFDGSTWTMYNIGSVLAIASDPDGSLWFSTWGEGVTKFDGSIWTVYNTSNSGLPENYVDTIASDPDGSLWFGTENEGVGRLWNYPANPILNNPLWLDDTHFQASFDITSLIPRGDYRITVADAVGSDGMQIAPNTAYTFTVDYAGGVGDTTPPGLPYVTACAGASMDDLSASWVAVDPDSQITLYQYAIGTAPGGTDVINWTFTDQTSFDLSGLTLTSGQLYYISVKARNAGGLWSEAATPEGLLPGSGLCTTNSFLAYLSLVSK